jgi:ribosomal protection tetracycline resistance protein
MDQIGTNKEELLKELKSNLNDGCIDFGQTPSIDFYDELAMCDEEMMEYFLEKGKIEVPIIKKAIRDRKVFPCYFGSALKLMGVKEFMQGLVQFTILPSYPEEFGAKIFKIARDEQGNRLTYLKITGGKLKVRIRYPMAARKKK